MPDIRDRFRSLDNQGAPDLWNEASARHRAARPERSWLARAGGALVVAAVVVLAVFVGIQLAGGGPLIGGDPSPSAEPSPSSEPTESVEPGPSVEPTGEPEPSTGPGPAFSCDLPISLDAAGTGFAPLIAQDIRVGTHDGYDRIVFEYDGGTPNVVLDIAEPPFVENPSGLPIDVAGAPVYSLTLVGASKHDLETGEQPYQGSTDFRPGFPQIAQFVEYGDFEAVHNWYLGSNGGTCLRAFTLTDPDRLVVDLLHPPIAVAETADGDFRLTISSPRTSWRSDEAIELSAELGYFGSPAQITLRGSGTGLIVFTLVELTGDRRMSGGVTMDCPPHSIAVGEPITTPYQKAGGYSPDDPDADFWAAFFADPEFRLPTGQWWVTAGASFAEGGDCGSNPVGLEASLVLTIE